MMKRHTLFQEFRKFEGQPVRIFTDDGKVHSGIDAEAFENGVRIIDECNRPIFIGYSHVDAVVEPQMRLQKCCGAYCNCGPDIDEISDAAVDGCCCNY